ncbi:hypothetical protein ACSBR2_000085 [Camellia fascicularis]
MMAVIVDDLVLEIISYLPLKFAVQCKVLNKNFNALISDHHFAAKHTIQSPSRNFTTLFHCSYIYPKIFYNILLNPPPHHAVNLPGRSVTLPLIVPILASSNGLLLLQFSNADVYCVCNPITMAYQLISYPSDSSFGGHVGLAVEPNTFILPQYKLVAIASRQALFEQLIQYEFHIFASDANSWRKSKTIAYEDSEFTSWQASISYENSEFMSCQAIYLNQCLHWLRECGDIVAFHTEKELCHIIKKPPQFELGEIVWFGVAECMITIVSSLKEEIVIRNYKNKSWMIRARITNIASPENDYRNGVPILFNGDRLLLQLRAKGIDGEIHMYDLNTSLWRKIGMVPGLMDSVQVFVHFVPTLAKVSTINHVPCKGRTMSSSLHEIAQSICMLSKLLT